MEKIKKEVEVYCVINAFCNKMKEYATDVIEMPLEEKKLLCKLR